MGGIAADQEFQEHERTREGTAETVAVRADEIRAAMQRALMTTGARFCDARLAEAAHAAADYEARIARLAGPGHTDGRIGARTRAAARE
jgi:hypothetical protein